MPRKRHPCLVPRRLSPENHTPDLRKERNAVIVTLGRAAGVSRHGVGPELSMDQANRRDDMRISRKDFEDAVERALERVPEIFHAQLKNMTIAVEDRPSRELLMEMDVPPDETLFGVFTGVPLPERSVTEPPLYPDVILIFREPLMAACHSRAELEEEIAITVVHELAHYVGLSEDRLDELGYG